MRGSLVLFVSVLEADRTLPHATSRAKCCQSCCSCCDKDAENHLPYTILLHNLPPFFGIRINNVSLRVRERLGRYPLPVSQRCLVVSPPIIFAKKNALCDREKGFVASLSQISGRVATNGRRNQHIIWNQPKIPLPLHQIFDSYMHKFGFS